MKEQIRYGLRTKIGDDENNYFIDCYGFKLENITHYIKIYDFCFDKYNVVKMIFEEGVLKEEIIIERDIINKLLLK